MLILLIGKQNRKSLNASLKVCFNQFIVRELYEFILGKHVFIDDNY